MSNITLKINAAPIALTVSAAQGAAGATQDLSGYLTISSAASTYAPIASPTFSGIVKGDQFRETVQTPYTPTTSITLDLSTGTIIDVTMTSGSDLTITMPTCVAGASFLLYIHQPASGSAQAVSWVDLIDWGSAGEPVITATVGKYDIISFVADRDGTYWNASYLQGYTST